MKLIEASSIYKLTGLEAPFAIWVKQKLQKYNEPPILTYSWRANKVGKARTEYLITQVAAQKLIDEYSLGHKDYEYIVIPNSKSPAQIHTSITIAATGLDMNDRKRNPAIRRVIDTIRLQLAKEEETVKKASIKHKTFYNLQDLFANDSVIKDRVNALIDLHCTSNPADASAIATYGIDWYIIVMTRSPIDNTETIHTVHQPIEEILNVDTN